jgi:hypothetical protein
MEQAQILVPPDYDLFLDKIITLTESKQTILRVKEKVVVITDPIEFHDQISKLLSDLIVYDKDQEDIFLKEEKEFLECLEANFKNVKKGIKRIKLDDFKELIGLGFISMMKRLEIIKSELSREGKMNNNKSMVLHIINTYFKIIQDVNERIIKLLSISIDNPNPRSFSKNEREKIAKMIRTQNTLFELTSKLTLNLIQLLNSIKDDNYASVSQFLLRSTEIWREYVQITKKDKSYSIEEIGEGLYV